MTDRASFLRLWFVLVFSFALAKLAFNLAFLGWVDLRPIAFWEIAVLPFVQALAFWAITRRRRSATDQTSGSDS